MKNPLNRSELTSIIDTVQREPKIHSLISSDQTCIKFPFRARLLDASFRETLSRFRQFQIRSRSDRSLGGIIKRCQRGNPIVEVSVQTKRFAGRHPDVLTQL